MKTLSTTTEKHGTDQSFHVCELDDVVDALEIAAKLDYPSLPGCVLGDSAVRVAELKAQVAALEAEIVAAYEASDDWAVAGHRSVAAALSHRGRLPRAEANQTVHLARSLREMPEVSEALADAEISVCHARRLARASVRDGFADAEALLCEQARTLRYTAFDKAVSYWEHLADTDAAERDATFKEQRREFHASMTFEGMGRLDGWLDPVGFEEFNNALDRIEKELFQNDLKVGQIEHIPKHAVSLWRTPAQRRADALVEMARRATAMPAGAKTPEPLVIIHMDKPTFETGLNQTLGVSAFDTDTPPPPTRQPALRETDNDAAPTHRLCETDNGAALTQTQCQTDNDAALTHRPGESDNGAALTQTQCQTDNDAALTHRPGESDNGAVLTQTQCQTDNDAALTHRPGESDNGAVLTQRLCETDSGAVLTPTQAVEQALKGHIRRLVYESPGVILDYGRSTRLFSGALRQAIQARDRTCLHPGCQLPARLCEIDHITEWQHGGTTTHTNADTRCSYHHRHHKPPI